MLLIFDIDGTLCNTKTIGDTCFIKTFEILYNCQLGNVEWEKFINLTDTGLYNDLFYQYMTKQPTKMEMIKFKTTYKTNLTYDFYKNIPNAVEGANQFLEFCKNQNTSIAIATGNWRSTTELKLNSCKIDFQEIPISTSNDALFREDIILSVIHKSLYFYHKPKFDKIIYFGDGLWDYECAKTLNINFIGVDIDNNKKLKKKKTQLVINNFNDYKNILKYLDRL